MDENSITTIDWSPILKALSEVKNLEDSKKIIDDATLAIAWATARSADEAAQMATEIKLRAERIAGQFLADMKAEGTIHRGGNQAKEHDVSLSSIGVEPQESKRWQRIAAIPEERFEDYLNGAKKKTQSALLQAAAQIESEENIKKYINEPIILPNGKYRCLIINPPDPLKK